MKCALSVAENPCHSNILRGQIIFSDTIKQLCIHHCSYPPSFPKTLLSVGGKNENAPYAPQAFSFCPGIIPQKCSATYCTSAIHLCRRHQEQIEVRKSDRLYNILQIQFGKTAPLPLSTLLYIQYLIFVYMMYSTKIKIYKKLCGKECFLSLSIPKFTSPLWRQPQLSVSYMFLQKYLIYLSIYICIFLEKHTNCSIICPLFCTLLFLLNSMYWRFSQVSPHRVAHFCDCRVLIALLAVPWFI